MITEWSPQDTTTQQDRVIAHVIGATVLGYFILDDAVYILLDIGFIWKIYVDGEMGLLPHPVMIRELEIDEQTQRQINTDVDMLLRDGLSAQDLRYLKPPPGNCVIEEVRCLAKGEMHRIFLKGEKENLAIDASMSTGAIKVAVI